MPLGAKAAFPRRAALAARMLLAAALLLFCIGASTSAQAQINCSASFTNVAFGNVDVLPGTPIDSAGALSTSCTGITGATKVILCFSMDNGSFALNGANRQMGSGANRLGFNLYQDAARSVVWSASGAGVLGVVLTAAAPSATPSVYARVPGSQQTVPPAAYTTTMTSSITGNTFTGAAPACSTLTTVLATRTFTVTATVVSSCAVTTTTLNFGVTSFFTANIDASNTVSVTCTATTPYHVRIDGGLAGGTTAAPRMMNLGANKVSYDLYRDAARSLYWGSTDSANTLDATGTAAAIGHTVYGRIPPQASQPPGTYTDTVVVVISFL